VSAVKAGLHFLPVVAVWLLTLLVSEVWLRLPLDRWLTLTILQSAALNVALATFLPVPEALAVTVNQREGYHLQWDRPKPETMQRFFHTLS
jgi:ABC-2 type transport system permease protein